uniref:Uncharacterized protein n=1 Tax=Strongyloides papillosus TaxID=174720 RepID=A0A0N5BBT7_STREA
MDNLVTITTFFFLLGILSNLRLLSQISRIYKNRLALHIVQKYIKLYKKIFQLKQFLFYNNA